YADIQNSSAGLGQAEASLRIESANLLFDLRKAFGNVLFSQEQLKVSQRIRDLRRKNSELVSLRYASGRESKGNMMRARAELLQADTDLAQAGRDLQAARQELNHQLGRDDFNVVTATGTLSTSESAPAPADWEPLVNRHPTVMLEQSNLSLARAVVRQSRSALWPNLSADYTRSFHGEDYFPGNPN